MIHLGKIFDFVGRIEISMPFDTSRLRKLLADQDSKSLTGNEALNATKEGNGFQLDQSKIRGDFRQIGLDIRSAIEKVGRYER